MEGQLEMIFRPRTKGSLSFTPKTLSREVSSDDARELQRALEMALGTVDLVITDNRRRMLTAKNERDRHQIRLHKMFLGCAAETFEALVGFINDDDASRRHINAFISQNHEVIRARPKQMTIVTKGEHHDLAFYCERMREFIDDPRLNDVVITWGRDGSGRRSIRFGSFDFSQDVIRIHPRLDQAWVPDYFVEYVVYHELLHGLFRPEEGSAERRNLHPPEFRAKEALYPQYSEAIQWEEDNLNRILRRRA